MQATKECIQLFVDEEFNGNYNECARKLDLSPSTIWRAANGTGKAGIKIITKVIEYCNNKGISYRKYISI